MLLKSLLYLLVFMAAFSIEGQERMILISPVFEWVDEKKKQTIHSFEGGGSEYSYERLINKKADKIDSVIVWVNGTRENIPGQVLDDSGKGTFAINELTDTVWFYSSGIRTQFYYHPGMQWMIRGFPLFFCKKKHTMLRSGATNIPIDIDTHVAIINRDYATCAGNEKWDKIISSWKAKYPGLVMSHDDRTAQVTFFGKDPSFQKKVLDALALQPEVESISSQIDNILQCESTYFVRPNLSIFTEAPAEQVEKTAARWGFSADFVTRSGNNYTLRYTKSKMLGPDYINNSKKLIDELGVITATYEFYHVVRKD
jgi:hypothetical protein